MGSRKNVYVREEDLSHLWELDKYIFSSKVCASLLLVQKTNNVIVFVCSQPHTVAVSNAET